MIEVMKRKEYRILAILGGTSLIGISVFFALGYRVSTKGFLSPSSISILSPSPQSSIFVDGNKKTTTKTANQLVEIGNLSAEVHNVLVAHTDFFPWAKNVSVEHGKTAELRPFLIPLAPQATIVLETNPLYREIKTNIAGDTLPSIRSPKTSADGGVSIWTEDSVVYAMWQGDKKAPLSLCESNCDRMMVFASDSPIRSLGFYTNRNDVIVIAVKSGIYAIEINASGIQNFQPLYEGKEPAFFKKGNTYQVIDDRAAFEISL